MAQVPGRVAHLSDQPAMASDELPDLPEAERPPPLATIFSIFMTFLPCFRLQQHNLENLWNHISPKFI